MANGGNLFVESGVPEDVMENLARRGHSVAVSLEAATSVQPSMSLIIGIAFFRNFSELVNETFRDLVALPFALLMQIRDECEFQFPLSLSSSHPSWPPFGPSATTQRTLNLCIETLSPFLIFARHVLAVRWRAYTDAPVMRTFACIIQRNGGPTELLFHWIWIFNPTLPI